MFYSLLGPASMVGVAWATYLFSMPEPFPSAQATVAGISAGILTAILFKSVTMGYSKDNRISRASGASMLL